MTEKEKDLLVKDLCPRLPYGVVCQVDDGAAGLNDGKLVEIDISKELVRFDADYYWDAYIDDIKPYLRSMSLMTESERFEVEQIIGYDVEVQDDFLSLLSHSIKRLSYLELLALFKWFNAHHFDYCGLIKKGLALEAPNGMYN